LLEAHDFWRRIDAHEGGALLVALLESWTRVGDYVGIDGVDFAENVFAAVCRFAMRNAAEQARLSMTVFAGYWPAAGGERPALDVLRQWLPMQLSSANHKVPIVGSWFVLQRVHGEAGHELFKRTQAELDARIAALPGGERHRPLYSSWEELMHQ
jgi:hypothetical protein